MIRYIIEKNGGKVTYNKSGGVTATIEDISRTYYGYTINSRMIVESDDLAYDFGLSGNTAIHNEGDKFDIQDDAALAFGLKYNEKSINKGLEYGSLIYEQDGNYSFRQAVEGDAKSIPKMPQKNDAFGTLVAWAHTHGSARGYGSDFFTGTTTYRDGSSSGDGALTLSLGADGYVFTANGYFKMLSKTWVPVQKQMQFIPEPNKYVRTIADNMPY